MNHQPLKPPESDLSGRGHACPQTPFLWKGLLEVFWWEAQDTLFLFCRQGPSWFQPLPPLGARAAASLEMVFSFLDRLNPHPQVSRIEGIDSSEVSAPAPLFCLRASFPEYLLHQNALQHFPDLGPTKRLHPWILDRIPLEA